MQWITDGSKPQEKRKLLFVVGNNDIRLGNFLNQDQWGRKFMFCDGSFFNIESVKKWAYVEEDESPKTEQGVEAVEFALWIADKGYLPQYDCEPRWVMTDDFDQHTTTELYNLYKSVIKL